MSMLKHDAVKLERPPTLPGPGQTQVRILVTGRYADFADYPPRIRATNRAAGDVVDYPTWYAADIVKAGLAEVMGGVVDGPVALVEVGPEAVIAPSDPDLADHLIWAMPEATPAAIRLAVREGLDLRAITGTGQDGRITVADVRRELGGGDD
ncbi:MAG: E3 binding domain-containing protein [Chloroflexi bacterium]|nr:E3 binding domain-containing protein [Chloroflexota bacterium]MBU1747005.1 E3 binding domain-containing protein [Chloroflexota bacterium]